MGKSDSAIVIETFFKQFPERAYKKGQIIIYADENPDVVFYLTYGEVKQYALTAGGDEIILNIYHPNSFFPLATPICNVDNIYFFEAYTDCVVHRANANETVAFIKKDADVVFALLQSILMQRHESYQRIKTLMKGGAKKRILYELITESLMNGSKRMKWHILKITEGQMAARTGLSRETISREFHKLQAEGHIIVKYKTVVVRNVDELRLLLDQ